MRKLYAIFLLLLLSNLYAQDIVVYVNSHLNKQVTIDRWQSTIDLLNKSIKEHNFTLLPILPSQVDKVKKILDEKKIHFLLSQPAITTELIHTKHISPLLTMANVYKMSTFGSVFITQKQNTAIKKIEDMKGKTIAAVAPLAFGGWLVGYSELYDKGIDPLKDKKVTFLDNQNKIIQAVIEGKYDVGIVRTGMVEKLSERKIVDATRLKFINEQKTSYPVKVSTKLYPEWTLSMAPYVDIDLASQVAKVLCKVEHTDIAAIQGEYYHWTPPVSHKDVDQLFKKLRVGYYKDLPRYHTKDLIEVVVFTVLIVLFLTILVVIYLKYKYTAKLKDKLYKSFKQQEKEIERLHTRLFLAADSALAGYWEWHLDTNQIYFSKGYKKFLGYGENELDNSIEQFQDLMHPEDYENTMDIVKKYIEKKEGTYKAKFRLKTKSGEYKWVSAIGAIPNSQDNIFFGFHIDINDLTTTKETLIAQSKSAMMGEMLGLIAHQFKQPLSVISMLASTQLASIELEEEITEDMIINDAQENLKQVLYLSETIDTFRDFLKPNSDMVRTTIESVCEGALGVLHKSLENNSIELIKEFSSTPEIKLNHAEMMQVFINIINNSKDAFKIKDIKNRAITVRTLQQEQDVIVEIEDTAGGIPLEKVDKVFEPYFTTKEEHNGTGLGLYIAKTIIQEHYNGSISVINTGRGVKFTIMLPA